MGCRSFCCIEMQWRIGTSTYYFTTVPPFYCHHLLLLTMKVLNRKTTTTVPDLYCVIIWSWCEDVWRHSKTDTTRPLGMCLISMSRPWRLSSIPHSNLPILMSREYLIAICIKRCGNRISGFYSLWSYHFDNISDCNLVGMRRWYYFLICDPI